MKPGQQKVSEKCHFWAEAFYSQGAICLFDPSLPCQGNQWWSDDLGMGVGMKEDDKEQRPQLTQSGQAAGWWNRLLLF